MFRALQKILVAIGLVLAFVVIGSRLPSAEAVPIISLSNPGIANCGIPTTVRATVTESIAGTALPGAVTFSSGQGTFSPNPAAVIGSVATTNFTPFLFSGTATLVATATGPGGTGTSAPIFVTIVCGSATGLCNPAIPSTCVGFGGLCNPFSASTCVVGAGSFCNPTFPTTCTQFGCAQIINGVCVRTNLPVGCVQIVGGTCIGTNVAAGCAQILNGVCIRTTAPVAPVSVPSTISVQLPAAAPAAPVTPARAPAPVVVQPQAAPVSPQFRPPSLGSAGLASD